MFLMGEGDSLWCVLVKFFVSWFICFGKINILIMLSWNLFFVRISLMMRMSFGLKKMRIVFVMRFLIFSLKKWLSFKRLRLRSCVIGWMRWWRSWSIWMSSNSLRRVVRMMLFRKRGRRENMKRWWWINRNLKRWR